MNIRKVSFFFNNGTFTPAPADLIQKWNRCAPHTWEVYAPTADQLQEMQGTFNETVARLSTPKPNRNKFVTYMNAMVRTNGAFLAPVFKEGQDPSEAPVDLTIIIAEHLGILYNKRGDMITDRIDYPLGW